MYKLCAQQVMLTKENYHGSFSLPFVEIVKLQYGIKYAINSNGQFTCMLFKCKMLLLHGTFRICFHSTFWLMPYFHIFKRHIYSKEHL
jgi:hypothetical protein